jgi:hypothetical protein
MLTIAIQNKKSADENMQERRETADRRGGIKNQGRCAKSNRRIAPDRRLNNIVVEWIPFNHLHLHPQTRQLFAHLKH